MSTSLGGFMQLEGRKFELFLLEPFCAVTHFILLPVAFRTSSRLPTLTTFYPTHTLGPTCSTKWSTHSSAGGGRSRNRESLCLTAMSFSVKKFRLVQQNKKQGGKIHKRKLIRCDCDRALCKLLPFSYVGFSPLLTSLKTGWGVSFENLLFSAGARY